MQGIRVWAGLLGVQGTVIEEVIGEEDEEGELAAVVVAVRLRKGEQSRCGRCRRRCPGYDQGEGRRRWRHLDLGTVQSFIEAAAPRVCCPEHGVVVAWVPWARHGAGHTRAFDDTAAWLAARLAKTAVVALLRVSWRTVGRIVTRVMDDARSRVDGFAGLRRIGIDEISFKRGHRYLTVVVDHDRGRLIWAAVGRSTATVHRFFDELGVERCAALTLVSSDGASWITSVVKERCPQARLCLDPFHVVGWVTKALDEVRQEVWTAARRAGLKAVAREVRGARFALWKNPEDLTSRQQAKLALIEQTNQPLYRAYLLKEQLRQVFQLPSQPAMELLDHWVQWARESLFPGFVRVSDTISYHRASIEAALVNHLSNARVEAINTRLRLLTRIAFGFRSPDALIALALLSLGGYCPPLPGRT